MYFSGRVNNVIYADPAQAFYVLKMTPDIEGDSLDAFLERPVVTVRGHVPGLSIDIGTWFGFEGKWTTHSKYGKQLAISKAPVLRDGWDANTAQKMLRANGVSKQVLAQIRQKCDDDEFLMALGDVDTLKNTVELDPFMAMYVAQRWQSVQAYFCTLEFISDLGLPPGVVRKVWSQFGDNAEQILSQNPWRLVETDSITFAQADSIAVRLRLPLDDPARVYGAVLYACRGQRNFGHLFLTTGQLFGLIKPFIQDLTEKHLASTLVECHQNGKLILDRTTRPGTLAVYEPWSYKMEADTAGLLIERQKKARFGRGGLSAKDYIRALTSVGPKTEKRANLKRPSLKSVVQTALEEWGESDHLVLSTDQQQGVQNALSEPVSILTGLPGTGKSTSLRAVVRILQESSVPFLLCAPTGIAAKNLANLTGSPAYTVHRAFAAKGSSNKDREATYTGVVGESGGDVGKLGQGEYWEYGPDKPHPAEVVVVDEASMLDQHLIYRLMTCTSPKARLVFVGDAAQLPSVGPGNVLRDLIAGNRFPVVALTQIFRQDDTSDIVFAAHDIYQGEVPNCDTKSDFSLVPVDSEDKVLSVILRLAEKLYDKRRNFQILSPRHAGTVGVTSLNANLRRLLNPNRSGVREIRLKDDVLREDDRIMVVKNNYKLGVYNGDVGKISRIDTKTREVELKIFGPTPLFIRVPFQDVPKFVRMAYSCTIHKAQGLEYDVIVMPVVDSFRHQLQRNLLYTAVTRAKKKVILVGHHSALKTAVLNNRQDLRNTLFADRLQGA